MRRVSAGMMYSGIVPRLLKQMDEAAVDGVEILSSALRTSSVLKNDSNYWADQWAQRVHGDIRVDNKQPQSTNKTHDAYLAALPIIRTVRVRSLALQSVRNVTRM